MQKKGHSSKDGFVIEYTKCELISFRMLTGSVRAPEDSDRQEVAKEAQPRKKPTQTRFSVI